MSKNIVLDIENVSKQYRLGEIGTGTLQHDLKRWWASVQGREDPFMKIGEANDRTQKGDSDYVWALRDINFQVEQGQAVGIIGRNGAGKSTLLKLLSKVTKPTTGTIKYKGRIASLLEVGTGFHPEMTGRENIYLNGAILGMSRKEISRKFDEIVDFAGVERYVDTPVKRYSSGMYVRLAFAVAAHLESEILIVDEVLAVGDAEFQKKCIGKMGDVTKDQGRTILFVSHNMASIQNLCDYGIFMEKGTVRYRGDIQKTVDYYLLNNSLQGNTKNLEKTYKSIYKSKIKSLSLKDVQTDLDKTSFKMGEDIKIRVELDIRENFENLGMNVRMNDVYGNGIAAWRTSEMGIEIKNNEVVELTIQNLNVFDGNYNFSISILNNKETIDYVDARLNMEIIPYELEVFGNKSVNRSNNLIYTPAVWKV